MHHTHLMAVTLGDLVGRHRSWSGLQRGRWYQQYLQRGRADTECGRGLCPGPMCGWVVEHPVGYIRPTLAPE